MKPEIRRWFPVTDRYAYFNCAANAPLALPVLDAITGYIEDLGAHGSRHYQDWFRAAREARSLAERLIGARPGEVALVKSTSDGMNIVANGLGLGEGDSVVLVRGDFPANVHPWKRLQAGGVEVRMAEPDDWNRVSPERLLELCDARTRLVSVSFVSFSNGFRLDLTRLGALLRKRGILLFVDAIQGLGTLPLDVRRDHVDFLAADAHKGLLTPEGIGLFFVREELLPRLQMTFVSWLSMKDPFENVDYRGRLLEDARRFEYATPNTAGIFALRAALELLLSVGVENIERHVLELTDALCAGLEQRGCRIRSPRGAGEKSGIVAFQVPGVEPAAAVARLLEQDVQIAERAGMLRASAHLYNDASDVERLLHALDGIAPA